MYYRDCLEPIIAFIQSIGIETAHGPGGDNGFLPGVNIHAGVIYINPENLIGSGDLLHEAGHFIAVPRRFWRRLGRDLQADVESLLATEKLPDGSEDPLLQHAVKQGEMMAQAWSYAAALHIGVPPACIFFPGAYKRNAYDGVHPMQAWLESGGHYGPLALARHGMTGFSGLFHFMGNNGLRPFPEMARWTLD